MQEIFKLPFVDTSRVAVWGWSGGGSATLNLMFQYPEIFKTGISIAGVASQLTYDNIYQERYMGLPQDNAENYKQGSPVTFADKLQDDEIKALVAQVRAAARRAEQPPA